MPRFQITWSNSENKDITKGKKDSTKEIENTKRVTSISKLTFTAKKEHHNTTLTCSAQNPADSMPKSTSIHLVVEYAPHVTVKADHETLFEDETVVFTCDAHANPSQMNYR